MRGRYCSNKKLAPVAVGARIGHGQKAWLVVLQSESLVLELATVDTLPTPSVPSGEVSTLPYYLVKKRFIVELLHNKSYTKS